MPRTRYRSTRRGTRLLRRDRSPPVPLHVLEARPPDAEHPDPDEQVFPAAHRSLVATMYRNALSCVSKLSSARAVKMLRSSSAETTTRFALLPLDVAYPNSTQHPTETLFVTSSQKTSAHCDASRS